MSRKSSIRGAVCTRGIASCRVSDGLRSAERAKADVHTAASAASTAILSKGRFIGFSREFLLGPRLLSLDDPEPKLSGLALPLTCPDGAGPRYTRPGAEMHKAVHSINAETRDRKRYQSGAVRGRVPGKEFCNVGIQRSDSGLRRARATAIKARPLTRMGYQTCETQGTGIRNRTSAEVSPWGQRTVAQSPA